MYSFPPKKVSVQGHDFHLRYLDWEEVARHDALVEKLKSDVKGKLKQSDPNFPKLVCSLLSLALCDEEGNRLYDDHDERILKFPFRVSSVLYVAASKLNLVTADDIEAVKKN